MTLSPVCTEPVAVITHKELCDKGIIARHGLAQQVFAVHTIETATGRRVWTQRFDTRAEALNWIKWA
jgi:hypothetical protein